MCSDHKSQDDYDKLVEELQDVSASLEREQFERKVERAKAEKKQTNLYQKLIKERDLRIKERAKEKVRFNGIEQEKLERLRFFSLISHDLRAPLITLTGYLSLLLEDFDEVGKDETRKNLLNFQLMVSRLSNLTESLLKWTMHKMDKFECEWQTVDLKELIDRNSRFFFEACKQKGISFINELCDSQYVLIDYDMIDAALRNFLSNAIKYTAEKGTIRIGAKQKEESVVVFISDSGVGIDKDQLANLFSSASNKAMSSAGTNGEAGSGMGLLLAKELVQKSGGTVQIESQKGEGTTVLLTLMRVKEDAIRE